MKRSSPPDFFENIFTIKSFYYQKYLIFGVKLSQQHLIYFWNQEQCSDGVSALWVLSKLRSGDVGHFVYVDCDFVAGGVDKMVLDAEVSPRLTSACTAA